MASKMSMPSSAQFSVNTGVSGATPTPPVPELRPSTDSNSRQRVDPTCLGGGSFQSRTDSPKHLLHPLPRVLEADVIAEEDQLNLDLDVEKEEMDDDGYRPLSTCPRRRQELRYHSRLVRS